MQEYERVLRYKEKKFGVGSKGQLKTKTNLALVLFELKRYKDGLENLYFCLGKYKTLVERDKSESNNTIYAEFIRQFTTKMRELCKN